MKKLLIPILFLLVTIVYCQDLTQNYRKIILNSPNNVSLFQSNSTNGIWASGMVTGDHWGIFEDATSSKEHLSVLPGGNIGIGTSSPSSKLHIYVPSGSAAYPTATNKGDVVQTLRSNNNGVEIGNSRGFNDRKAWILARHSSVSSYGKYYSVLHLQPDVGDKSQYKGVSIGYSSGTNLPVGTHLAVNGKVGIGTTSPDSELTVNGHIHAQEVKVDLNVPGPDYVFKEGYDLKSLEEVQNHIHKHGHLPNIPSAKEMEANGIDLGEMNLKLLEKIEELTLYAIAQQKTIEQLEKQLQKDGGLRDVVEALQRKLDKIDKRLKKTTDE